MQPREPQPRPRYSCQEAHEDSELVLSDRATQAVRELYDEHLRACRDCRRMHRALYAIYEGPVVPTAPAGLREEKEFHAILRRMKTERREPWYRKWAVGATVGGLATAAAVLTLTLFDVAPEVLSLPKFEDEGPEPVALVTGASGDDGSDATTGGGIEHPAQSYGRIVGGLADLVTPGGQSSNTNTFPVGTHFEVNAEHPLQVGLVGKIVANFTPSSRIEWTAASPSLLELEVERGIAAVRYDRRPSDPVLQIRTPTAVVRVIGTVFTVQVEPNDNTIVSVLRGQVEVLHPKTNRLLAEVESGFRYDVGRSTFDDPGLTEVEAALPLSNDPGDEDGDGSETLALADGRIPPAWNVPGLPQDPRFRTMAYVPARPATAPVAIGATPRTPRNGGAVAAANPPAAERRPMDDDGEDLIESLMRDAELTRRKELRASLETCRGLYEAVDTRYLAAKCLSTFIDKYGSDPLAVEGYLLVGILRMDYALDYEAAEVAFQTFLRRAPNHPSAELALFRMWLASTENGRITEALDRGRKYLARYPNGKYVGKVLQRFPELKSEL
ncbi:MAG: FecR domain-containing protein [Deltaproteobacteria bacterium]|nr:FecR domain-containing protein [Deltaproteobacteria bacterium]MBK8239068.1 FecR domain-containing protein [Deltaproteobacteria bacterium]MBK8717578.1 FecR domain-containing protein [Deltaproteobacteria bacterium]MBP7285813.1 FecR domain-containing protein [Nannocystaceae bacterium]